MKHLRAISAASCLLIASCTSDQINQARYGLSVAGQLVDVLASNPKPGGKESRSPLP